MEIKKQTSTKEKLITTSILILSLFILSFLVPFLKVRFLTQFFPLIYSIICVYYLMKYIVNKYTYTFTGNTLVIEKTTGRSTTTVLNVYYSKIKSVTKTPCKAFSLTVSPFNKNCLYITCVENKAEKKYKIHGDDELITAFKEKLGDRFHE